MILFTVWIQGPYIWSLQYGEATLINWWGPGGLRSPGGVGQPFEMHWPKAKVLGFSDDNYESKGHIYGPYNTAKPHLYTGGVQGASGPLVGLVSHLKYIDLRQQC